MYAFDANNPACVTPSFFATSDESASDPARMPRSMPSATRSTMRDDTREQGQIVEIHTVAVLASTTCVVAVLLTVRTHGRYFPYDRAMMRAHWLLSLTCLIGCGANGGEPQLGDVMIMYGTAAPK